MTVARAHAFAAELSAVKSALRQIGYRGKLLAENYVFADFLAEEPVRRSIPVAAFAQDPPSYVNACFGVVLPDCDPSSQVRKCTALGAPQILVLQRGAVERWATRSEGSPEKLESIPTTRLEAVFNSNRADWSPDVLLRAKGPFPSPGARQLDFVDLGLLPALQHQAQAKLDELIVDVVREAQDALSRRGQQLLEEPLFELLFGLIRAKVLRDTNAIPNLDLADPQQALRQVASFYPRSKLALRAEEAHPCVLRLVADRVRNAFLLDNLSPDTLAYVYENTLVTREQRKELGVHTTPPYVADYILARLPIGQIPFAKRNVLDPTCGAGTLLVAALRRLRSLLPASMSAEDRHEYLVSHVRGMDCEAYSCEVAKLSLLFADLPNPNGWDIAAVDSFLPGRLEAAASGTRILVANPPFEAFTPTERGRYQAKTPYKGGEMLRRMLPALPPEALVGVVMPRKLLDGGSYRRVREYLVQHFDILGVTVLPDRVFPKSEAETALVVARKLENGKPRAVMVYREVARRDLSNFQRTHSVTWEEQVDQAHFAQAWTGKPVLLVPRLHSLWQHLDHGPTLEEFADVHRGVEYTVGLLSTHRESLVRAEPFPGSSTALDSVRRQLTPYVLSCPVHVATEARLRRGGAWKLDWCAPKVVTNANRSSRGPWRLMAAVDRDALLCLQTFHGVWPKQGVAVPLELLAAVLNGPVCNAYLRAHATQRHNERQMLLRVPFPVGWERIAASVVESVREYTERVTKEGASVAAALLVQIDADVLAAYHLPPREERRLLDLFWGEARPGCPGFAGYIPPEVSAWIPLTTYLAKEFERSTADGIRQRGAKTRDPDVLAFFRNIA